MSEFAFKLPDLGEGTVEAELIEWHVKPGDLVKEDDSLVDVMTDKANVEIPSPVEGRIVSVAGDVGDILAVGSVLVVFETDATSVNQDESAIVSDPIGPDTSANTSSSSEHDQTSLVKNPVKNAEEEKPLLETRPKGGALILTSPAVRNRARQAGVDLANITGTGPKGRILKTDLDTYISQALDQSTTHNTSPSSGIERSGTERIKVIGVRRVIAERMTEAKRTIPHFTYVDEVDVTELESLRLHLNKKRPDAGLTYLPFVMLALVDVLQRFPQCNAHYSAEDKCIVRHEAINIGVATQTQSGLKVPVVYHCEAKTLYQAAAEMQRVSAAARDGSANVRELSGSTITVTSLGKLGGIVSTPVLNMPEVSIIGLNRAMEKPVIINGQVQVRRMMNISSSFDHRFVDGADAAAMIWALKEMLEHPATIFGAGV
jgi:2-oxoisovalerate dehydrogenase E2 component (dihydrolipoyl transacylase)